ncbi:MAG: hypothetical protein M1609_02790 [Firmicutes bacterium]|nr:hypothetical protein [Bacillota bacterium]
MDTFKPPFWIGERQFSAADLALIKTIVAEFGQLSRRELAATVCENLSWRAPNGRLKINGCRLLLEKMHDAGLIVLPPKRSHSQKTLSCPRSAPIAKRPSAIRRCRHCQLLSLTAR